MDDRHLEKSILSTICYFDMFDYPLTLLEIWQWLFIDQPSNQVVSLSAIRQILESSRYLSEKLSFQNGFYFLKNRDAIVLTRLKRYALAGDKNKIAQKGVRLLKFLPFIRLIGLCNNSGNNNIRADSDIDLFIITAKNRLFTARFLITLAISFRRLRRHGRKVTDRLCLSFYVAEDDLDFSKIKIMADDIYLTYWIANLFPLYDRQAYARFLAQNDWIKNYLPNYLPKTGSFWRRIDDSWLSLLSFKVSEHFLSGWLGDQLEKFLKTIQLFKMSKNNKSLAQASDSRVIISETMLKFHENDRRLFYQKNFLDKLKGIISQ
ncbi:MAG: hypothetical protein A3B89_02980 [Candidatus Buchananbacteria bacterium RIFCSPHIGHO2_02_FULL_40_13]|uniref:Polymerase nucleotidyl transferase domain-containing protein n=1 Tax=Candidatus Buchananbacteria bacterium RIFCSPLOWO2_01_FULL_39_33 TaxID=1797543 RepID=A0A1G1YIH6_9BACT|nr:MAG: hypothetical protein A3B89_02980 [Candidatus Buchananbacteria bacterium RIFCSPHIGHO2_02_FULL_40_13]OGY51277.1 MAG: hypothetical protein A3A02_01550 [Candidatus Buchananbacteria bacterium RIFCSPLOWO2_01_FULL_39_33]